MYLSFTLPYPLYILRTMCFLGPCARRKISTSINGFLLSIVAFSKTSAVCNEMFRNEMCRCVVIGGGGGGDRCRYRLFPVQISPWPALLVSEQSVSHPVPGQGGDTDTQCHEAPHRHCGSDGLCRQVHHRRRKCQVHRRRRQCRVRGPTGQKRGVSIEYSDGTKQFYDGPRGAESVVKIEYPDGETVFYEGPRGEERVLRVEHRNCREGEDTYSYSSALPNRSPPSHRSHHQRNALSTSKPYCAAPAPSDQQSNPASRGFLPRSPGSMSAQGTTLQPRSVVWTKPPSHDRISTYQPGLLASRLNPRVSPRTAALAEGTRRNNN